jgi:hypothetical protein
MRKDALLAVGALAVGSLLMVPGSSRSGGS